MPGIGVHLPRNPCSPWPEWLFTFSGIDVHVPPESVFTLLRNRRSGWAGICTILQRCVSGLPLAIRCDNGPEILSQAFVNWCQDNEVEIRYIQPGKPNQNAFVERFNRTFREEVLNAWLFEDLRQVRELSAKWMKCYNEQRPHDSLGRIPPSVFRERLENAEVSTYELST